VPGSVQPFSGDGRALNHRSLNFGGAQLPSAARRRGW